MADKQNPNKNQQNQQGNQGGGQQGQNAGQKPGQQNQDPGQGQQGQNPSQKPGQQSQNQDPQTRRPRPLSQQKARPCAGLSLCVQLSPQLGQVVRRHWLAM